jgi:hypothetical protein
LNSLERMALLEVHDNVDITDFSKLTSAYRLRKEKNEQEWDGIESSFVSAGPRPVSQQPCAPSDVKLAVHSACPKKRLCDSHAHGGEDDSGRSMHSESQQGKPTPLDRGTPLPIQRQTTDTESDFCSEKQDLHSEGDVKTAKDDDIEEEQAMVFLTMAALVTS